MLEPVHRVYTVCHQCVCPVSVVANDVVDFGFFFFIVLVHKLLFISTSSLTVPNRITANEISLLGVFSIPFYLLINIMINPMVPNIKYRVFYCVLWDFMVQQIFLL